MPSTRRALFLTVAVCLVLLGSAVPASAHAMLESTQPAAGTVLAVAPATVVLHFGEDVALPPKAVRVLSVQRHDQIESTRVSGHFVTARLAQHLPAGSYLVVWRVVSADSHPVTGSFAFSVGHSGALATLRPPSSGRGVAGFLAAARGVGYLGLAAFAGGIWFGLLCWAGLAWSPRGRRLVVVGWAVAMAGGLASLLLQGPYGRGAGLGGTFDPALLRADLGSRFGHAVLARLVLLGLAGWLASRLRLRHSSTLSGAFGFAMVVLLATYGWTGHAGVGEWLPLSVASDVVHLVAMSLWLGGLLQLVVAVLPIVDLSVARQVATRFSRVAALSVTALVITGTFQAWRQVATVTELWSTGYGRLLLAKVTLVLVVLLVATRSRRWVLHHGDRVVVAAHLDVAVSSHTQVVADLRPLRRAVMAEAVLLLGVLAVTAFLVSAPPARDTHPTAPAGQGAPGRPMPLP